MNYKDKLIVVSVSGGKDSTAMCLHLFEQGYKKEDFVRIFADTGWESEETYRYLKELEKVVGSIKTIRNTSIKVKEEDKDFLETIEGRIGYSPMVRSILYNGMFPSGKARFCTRMIKMEIFNQYFNSLDCDYVNLNGIRREESKARKDAEEWNWNEGFDCWVHSPLVEWDEQDVINIHQRFGLPPNRMYFNGASRVGCFPCIKANKAQIAMLTPERIEIIRMLEGYLSQKKGKDITFFKARKLKVGTYANIDDIVHWSNDGHVEKDDQEQLLLFESPVDKECRRWGFCGV
jgi:3'-phosphoadenosine 5'-phosphosulfate sulfotransferase (PAPS reductase)/FAD synthetase